MSHKLAIIEDDPAISQMYRMKFETEGYKVETAENGKIGLDMIEKMKPILHQSFWDTYPAPKKMGAGPMA